MFRLLAFLLTTLSFTLGAVSHAQNEGGVYGGPGIGGNIYANNPGGNVYGGNGDQIYVSDGAYGAYPDGNDGNAGTAAAPLKTWAAAYAKAVARPGSTIWLNGNPASKVAYGTTNTTLAVSVTVRALYPGGATLSSSSTTTRNVTVNPPAGGRVVLMDMACDVTANAAGTADRCVDLLSPAAAYVFQAINVTFTAGLNGAVYSSANNHRAYVSILNSTCTGDAVNGCYLLQRMIEGNVSLTGGSCTIANLLAGGACAYVRGFANGVTFTMTGTDCTASYDASNVAGYSYCMYALNAKGFFTGGTHQLLNGTGSARGGVLRVETSGVIDISGSYIVGPTAYNGAVGGITCGIGEDGGLSASRPLKTNVVVDGCDADASAASKAAGVHGPSVFSSTNGVVKNSIARGGICFVDKDNYGATFHNNQARDCTSSGNLCKGSDLSTYHTNLSTNTTAGSSAPMVYAEVNSVTGLDCTNLTVRDNRYVNAGATGVIFQKKDVGSTATYLRNSYERTAGTFNANPWQIDGVNFPDFVTYQATIEPTATKVGAVP